MGPFGWDLPPGVSMRDIDPEIGPCEVCGKHVDDCICPECTECHEHGNPKCYTEHGMKKTKEQEIGSAKIVLAELKQKVVDQEQYLSYLEES